MRPSDENQHGSTRPNLLSASSRSPGSNEKILARLDRGVGRGPSPGLSPRARLIWTGLAGSVVLALIGALALITHDNVNSPHALLVAANQNTSAPAPLSPATPDRPAVIIDEPVPPSELAMLDEPPLPALVTLAQEPAAPAAAPAAPAARAPKAAMPPPKLAQKTSKPASLTAKMAGPAHTTSRPQVPKSGIRVASLEKKAQGKGPVHAAKAKAVPPPLKAEETPVDTDVAMITAIMAQSARHTVQRPQGDSAIPCGGKRKCQEKETFKSLD